MAQAECISNAVNVMETSIFLACIGLIMSGIMGSVVPGVPGSPLFLAAICLARFGAGIEAITNVHLGIMIILVLLSFVIDFVLPLWTTKRFGGTKYGVWGSIIGLIVGIVAPIPFGMILGPFLGAVIGEYIGGKDNETAFKSGIGNFIGFVASTFFKLCIGGWALWLVMSNLGGKIISDFFKLF